VNIITEPIVYLAGYQVVDNNVLDRFLVDHDVGGWTTDTEVGAEVLAETAGRLCYMSFAKPRPGGNAAYLHHIKEVGHGSVLEHAVWTFVITGVSRTLTHELVRHRAGWAYSQLSQRYVDESVAEYVVPDIIAADPTMMWMWSNAMTLAHAAYVELVEKLNQKLAYTCSQCGGPATLETMPCTCAACGGRAFHGTELRKTARQAARSVLPNATETKIAVTVNCRAARHFIEQRGSRHADQEIRKLAYKVWQALVAHSPNLFSDYSATPLPDGTHELTTKYPKV